MASTTVQPSLAASAGHTFICYARLDEAFVVELAAGLRRRGVPLWIDQFDIEPGADWGLSVDNALKTCATFLIILSPRAVASEEVRGELRVALDSGKRIVPLVYETCDIPPRLRLRQQIDFTRTPGVSDASIDRLAAVLLGRSNGAAIPHPTPEQDRRHRHTLLADLKAEARDRLRGIGTDMPVPVRLEREPHHVERPWDTEAGATVRPRGSRPLPDLLTVFDDETVGGHLLILGAPGSGKTTALVQLLQQLVARAEGDEGCALPALVSLASWKRDTTIGTWLVGELKAKHGVRADHGTRWRDAGRLAPLLDGLDELPAEDQEACVEAINEFQQTYRPPHLVVCCRRAEYENFTVKLRLRDAVGLQPLDADQIRAYLDRSAVPEIWNTIAADPALMEMAESPLLLSFMSDVLNQPDAQGWQRAASAAERRRRLFDAYVSSRLSIAAPRQSHSGAETLDRLRKLATILRRQGLSEFLVERMQPDWLESSLRRWAYRAGVLVITATAVLVVQGALLWLFGWIPAGRIGTRLQESGFVAMPEVGSLADRVLLILLAIIIGSIVALRRTIIPIETLTWSWPRAWINMGLWARKGAGGGLDYGILIGAVMGLVHYVTAYEAGAGPLWQETGRLLGSAGSVLAVIFLARVKASAVPPYAEWSVTTPRTLHALTAAGLYALVSVAGWSLESLTTPLSLVPIAVADVLIAFGVFAVIGLSALSPGRSASLLKASVVGLIAGATSGALTWAVTSSPASFHVWFIYWMSAGLSVGVIAGLLISLGTRLQLWRRARLAAVTASTGRAWWRRTAATGLIIGLSLAAAATVLTWVAGDQLIRNITVLGVNVQVGFELLLVTALLYAIAVGVSAAMTAGVLGALAGILSGATGADVERRLTPNQGIRQSARNVGLFAVLGVLIIGVPYGVLNVVAGAVGTGALPSTADWLRLGAASGVGFGLLAGLLPGAACIQHFVLRFVLWASGTLPLRWVSFLDFATQRRLLQRVGGRYRFIHVLLRDHLSGTAAK